MSKPSEAMADRQADVAPSSRNRLGPFLAIAFLLLAGFVTWRWTQPLWWRRSAVRLMQQRRFEDARPLLERYRQRRPEDVEAIRRLAQIYESQGDWAAVQVMWRQVPEESRWQQERLTELGRSSYQLHHLGDAEQWLTECIRRYPRSMLARRVLLDVYRWQRRDQEGRVVRRELEQLMLDLPIADRLWIMFRSFVEEYTQIEATEQHQYLQRCAKAAPEDVMPRIAMARHFLLEGREVQKAASQLQRLMERVPNHVAGIAAMTHYYVVLNSRAPDQAQAWLDRWPEALRQGEYWGYRGMLNEALDELPQAVAAYRAALTTYPDHATALLRLGMLLSKEGRQEGSAKLSQEGTDLAEKTKQVQATRSWAPFLLQHVEQWQTAFNLAKRGAGPFPEDELLARMAEFYHRVFRPERERDWLTAHQEYLELIARARGVPKI